MKRCEDCRHWEAGKSPSWLSGRGICWCSKLCESYAAASEDDDDLVYSYNEDGAFYTGPKFGCVHHKENK